MFLHTCTCGRKVIFAAQATNPAATQVPDSLPTFAVGADGESSQVTSLKAQTNEFVLCKLSKSYLIDTDPVGTIGIVPTSLVRQGRTLAITQIRISDDLLKIVFIRVAADTNRILANIPGPVPPTSMTTSASTTTTASTTTSSTRSCDRHHQEQSYPK